MPITRDARIDTGKDAQMKEDLMVDGQRDASKEGKGWDLRMYTGKDTSMSRGKYERINIGKDKIMN